MPWRSRPTVRFDPSVRSEAIFTGLLGAGVVAGFYFLLDLARGRPLMTPTVLGDVLLLHRPIAAVPETAAVLGYTIVHLIAFVTFGFLLTLVVRAAERSALARYAVVQLVVVFELFFYGLLMIASEQARGLFPFVGVLAANSLAAIVMLVWQWRQHPRLAVAFRDEPLGATDRADVTVLAKDTPRS